MKRDLRNAMGTRTIQIDGDKYERLRQLAATQQLSVAALIDELISAALSRHEAEERFHARAQRGSMQRGHELLGKLDQHFASN